MSDLSLLVNTTVGGTTLESLESALLLDLDPGTYTVIMNPMGTSQEGKGILSVSAFGISKISIRAHGEMGNLRHGITLSELSAPHYDDPFIHPPYSASSQTRILASAKGAASLSQYGISNGMTDPSINIVQIASADIIAENDDWDPQNLPRVLGFERPHGTNESVVAPFLPGGANYLISINDKGESGIVESSSVVLHEVFNLGPEDVTTGVGTAPESLSGMVMSYNEIVVEANGSETDRGMFFAKFEDDRVHFKEYDYDIHEWHESFRNDYSYFKTDGNTARLSITDYFGNIWGLHQVSLFSSPISMEMVTGQIIIIPPIYRNRA